MNERYIDMDEVRNNPNKCWDKRLLSMNKQLTVKDVETLILPNSIDDWDWRMISKHINIKEVINNPNGLWNIRGLLWNKGATVKILEFFDAGLIHHLQVNIPEFKYHTDMIIKCECQSIIVVTTIINEKI